MKTTSGYLTCLIGIALFSATNHVARANSTLITFSVDMANYILYAGFTPGSDFVSVHGTFNNWGSGVVLVQEGSSTVYTNTVNDTTDANGNHAEYKFVIDNDEWESVVDGDNRAVALPPTSGASVVLPTPYFDDYDAGYPVNNTVFFQVDMAQQVKLGTFVPGSSTVEVQGNFEGWSPGQTLTHDPGVITTNQSGVTATNVYDGYITISGSPGQSDEYKFVIEPSGSYESPAARNGIGYVNGNNRFFADATNATVILPIASFSDAPYAPLARVTFSVDMTAQLYYGNWQPSDGVFCAGVNGDWNNDAANTMTNNPLASNTNLYYGTFTLGEGSPESYKFTYNDSEGTVYESPTSTGGNNRGFIVPTQPSVFVPTAYFGDIAVNDLLANDVNITFSVDMSQAVQYGTSTAFNPSSDIVFVNGAWLGWLGWDPISLASYQLTNNPVGSSPNVYSGTFPVPMGSSFSMIYKYSIDGPDDEAAYQENHIRVIRSLSTGAYVLPTDTFGNPYAEPAFGQLALAQGAPGNVQLSWLGAPNVQVQTCSNLTGGGWTSVPGTSGASWSSGTSSINGLVSVTNWPTASGSTYFRLVEQ